MSFSSLIGGVVSLFVVVSAENCGSKPLDIYFSLDASNSVTQGNWPLVKNFVTDLIETEIDSTSNIGVNHFAKGVWSDWQFTNTQDPRDDMINTITNIEFPPSTYNGQTWTKSGVAMGMNQFAFNGRPIDDADRLLVLMTDGEPYPQSTQSHVI
jgi:hypothetical protein